MFKDEVKKLLKEVEDLESRLPYYQNSPRKQDIVGEINRKIKLIDVLMSKKEE